MRCKQLYPVLFCFLMVFGCTEEKASQNGFVISGKIVGANGQRPAAAHVHWSTLEGDYSDAIVSKPVAEDGSYSVAVEEPGLYRVWATATDHQAAGAPVIIEPDDSHITVNLQMALHEYKDAFDEITVIGSWDSYSRKRAGVMQRQADGTFIFETEVDADTVGYQLIGLVESGRSMNGTQSDFYEYDGGGDYRSMLVPSGNKVRVVFDPAQLPEPEGKNELRVVYDDAHQYLAEMIAIDRKADQALEQHEQEKEAKGNGVATTPSEALLSLVSYLTEHMQNAENRWVRQYAAMQLARSYYYEVRLDAATYSQILDTVPVTSPLWSLAVDPTALGLAVQNPELANSLLEDIHGDNPDRTTQAKALANQVLLAQLQGDQEKYKSLYAELESKYQDVSAIRYKLQTLDPESETAVGKPVPDFEVTLMSSNRTVSDESLRGQYYFIDFWATWCDPCIREMPNLHQAYQEYKNHGFTILSLSLDNKPKDVIEFRRTEWEMPWLHAFLEDGWRSETVRSFNVSGIPSPFLVSPDGRIVASHMMLRGEYLDKTLARVMGTN